MLIQIDKKLIKIFLVGLQNWLYQRNEQMEWTDFLHVDAESQNKKWSDFFGWAWSKMGVASLVTGLFKIDYLKIEQNN